MFKTPKTAKTAKEILTFCRYTNSLEDERPPTSLFRQWDAKLDMVNKVIGLLNDKDEDYNDLSVKGLVVFFSKKLWGVLLFDGIAKEAGLCDFWQRAGLGEDDQISMSEFVLYLLAQRGDHDVLLKDFWNKQLTLTQKRFEFGRVKACIESRPASFDGAAMAKYISELKPPLRTRRRAPAQEKRNK